MLGSANFSRGYAVDAKVSGLAEVEYSYAFHIRFTPILLQHGQVKYIVVLIID